MLELKRITKIYHSKAQDVKALDHVDLYFEEKGMVFITGKSGSGKTTLLNVIGGLDNFDHGELVIKGRSSYVFSKSDYDSYRNTYIGFVFQEYNLIDSMTIEKNLSLATELQGKKASHEEILKLLKSVDLDDVANRKPQELSGGQRQRVAIARALVKDPAIIMADEPTGALDTANGLQIMNILKKLSKTKLVIVVSHDMDLANKFADRIINLKDGKVDSDVTVTVDENSNKNIASNKDYIAVKRGAELSEEDVIALKEAVVKGKDVLVTDNININKKATQITDKKQYGRTHFIKTHMGFWDTIKLGLGTLRTKVVRLIITILLCALSFSVFGIFDSMAIFDEQRLATNTLRASIAPSIAFSPKIIDNENGKTYDIKVNDGLIESLEKQTGYSIKGVYSSYYIGENVIPTELNNNVAAKIGKYYYYKNTTGAVEFSQEELSAYGFSMLYGRLPEEFDEIAVTEYYANCMINWWYNYIGDDGETHYVEKIEDLVNLDKPLTLTLGTGSTGRSTVTQYKIVGIVKTGTIDGKFDKLKGKTDKNADRYDEASVMDQEEFLNYINNGFFLNIFTKPGFVKDAMRRYKAPVSYKNTAYRYTTTATENYLHDYLAEGTAATAPNISSSTFYTYDDISNIEGISQWFFDDRQDETLEEDEILLNVSQLRTWFADVVSFVNRYANPTRRIEELDSIMAICQNDENKDNPDMIDIYNLAEEEKANVQTHSQDLIECYETAYSQWNIVNSRNANGEELTTAAKNWIEAVITMESYVYGGNMMTIDELFSRTYDVNKENTNTTVDAENRFKTFKDFRVVGVYSGIGISGDGCMVLTRDTISKLGVDLSQGVYTKLLATNLGHGNISKLSSLLYSKSGLSFETVNVALRMIQSNPDFFENLAIIFLIASGVFAIFSIVMFANLISTSIKDKYTEIGILRALGAKGSDILNIFIIESVTIALINAVVASIVGALGSLLVNAILSGYLNLYIPLATYGIREVLIIFGLSLGVGVISASIPIISISRQKPVETIRRAFD